METVFWVVLCIVAVIASSIRLAFVFPEKANKPIFWLISSASAVVFGVIVYFVLSALD